MAAPVGRGNREQQALTTGIGEQAIREMLPQLRAIREDQEGAQQMIRAIFSDRFTGAQTEAAAIQRAAEHREEARRKAEIQAALKEEIAKEQEAIAKAQFLASALPPPTTAAAAAPKAATTPPTSMPKRPALTATELRAELAKAGTARRAKAEEKKVAAAKAAGAAPPSA